MDTPKLLKTKATAAGIHFSISFVIFILMTVWFCLSLYPSFYFNMAGGIQGLCLMFFCDAVLGPLITFCVFNHTKPKREIITDLSIVALIQLSAFIYGFWAVYNGRPYVTIVYSDSTTIILPYQDVKDDKKYSSMNVSEFANSKIKSVPIGIYHIKDKKNILEPLSKASPEEIERINRDARKHFRMYAREESKRELAKLETKHTDVLLLFVIGKYTMAYICVDKQFNFIAKLDEENVWD
ncbi:MAG: hypothetical protein J6M05_03750 [Cardiobacteriaceae bacterium]|nr:hypothetical protein [Cardiobacteriaceae bacterium]